MPNSIDATRERILLAAQARVVDRSASRVSPRDIAVDADVSPARIVQCFGSKDELVFVCRIAQGREEIRADIARVRETVSGFGRIETLLLLQVDRYMRFPWIMKDLFANPWQWTSQPHAALGETMEPIRRLVADCCCEEWTLEPGAHDHVLGCAVTMVQAVFESSVREGIALNQSPGVVGRKVAGFTAFILTQTRAAIGRRGPSALPA